MGGIFHQSQKITCSRLFFTFFSRLGRRPVVNLETVMSQKLLLGMKQSEEEGSEEGTKAEPQLETEIELKGSGFDLTGAEGIWGQALVLEGPSRRRVCATIGPVHDILHPSEDEDPQRVLHVAEARFTSKVGGSVWFYTLETNPGSFETKIFTNLFNVESGKSTNNRWDVYVTDILDTKEDKEGRRRGGCDFLQNRYAHLKLISSNKKSKKAKRNATFLKN